MQFNEKLLREYGLIDLYAEPEYMPWSVEQKYREDSSWLLFGPRYHLTFELDADGLERLQGALEAAQKANTIPETEEIANEPDPGFGRYRLRHR